MLNEIAVSRTRSEPMSSRAALFALFDAVRDDSIGYGMTTIFGAAARDALIKWAAIHSLMIECRTLSLGDKPFTVWMCRVNDAGAFVEVQCDVGV